MCTLILEDVGYQLLTSSKSKAASLARSLLARSPDVGWVVSQWDISGHYVVFAVPTDPASIDRERMLWKWRGRSHVMGKSQR